MVSAHPLVYQILGLTLCGAILGHAIYVWFSSPLDTGPALSLARDFVLIVLILWQAEWYPGAYHSLYRTFSRISDSVHACSSVTPRPPSPLAIPLGLRRLRRILRVQPILEGLGAPGLRHSRQPAGVLVHRTIGVGGPARGQRVLARTVRLVGAMTVVTRDETSCTGPFPGTSVPSWQWRSFNSGMCVCRSPNAWPYWLPLPIVLSIRWWVFDQGQHGQTYRALLFAVVAALPVVLLSLGGADMGSIAAL